jgi:hypothetical protein
VAMNQSIRTGSTTTDGGGQRFIHSKLVKSPFLLTSFLRDQFGEGNYDVEVRSAYLFPKEEAWSEKVRHNVYCVKAVGNLTVLDLVSLFLQSADWLRLTYAITRTSLMTSLGWIKDHDIEGPFLVEFVGCLRHFTTTWAAWCLDV